MQIALFGAGTQLGRGLALEALSRLHELTVVARDPAGLDLSHPLLKLVKGDVLDPSDVALTAAGHDAVLSAYSPGPDGDPRSIPEAAHALLAGVGRAGVKRLIVVGGSGSLEAAPGLALLETPEFPEAKKLAAMAYADALAIMQGNLDLDWTFASPAASIVSGGRTGRFRTAEDHLLRDADGQSRISVEDFAAAVMDELEDPKFIRRHFTVAY